MRTLKKPEKPVLAKFDTKCTCDKGKVSYRPCIPYADIELKDCERCKGKGTLSVAELNISITQNYEKALELYKKELAKHKVLKKIKMTHEEWDVLFNFGLIRYREEYILES